MNNRILSCLICLSTCLGALAQSAPAGESTDIAVEQVLISRDSLTAVRLTNGMTVIVRPTHTAGIVHVQSYVRAGGIYEGRWLGTGISHLVEHLVAMGADHDHADAQETQDAKDARDDRISRIGGQSNAATSLDYTTYYISALSSKAGDCIDLICEWMARPSFTEKDFQREHGVVQRELELGRDSPSRLHWQAHAGDAFGAHPAAVPVIGYATPLAQLTYQDVLDYHAMMYSPRNMVLVIVGDVDTQFAIDRTTQALNGFHQARSPDHRLPPVGQFSGIRRSVLPNHKVKETTQFMSFQTIDLLHDDLYALDVLSYALTAGQSSRFVERLERKLQLVTSISSSSWTPAWGKGLFSFTFRCESDKADLAESAILEEIAKVRENGITEQELIRAKRQKVADHVYSQQSAESIARSIGMDWLTTGDPEFSANYTRRIQQVTTEQVLDVARRYLDSESFVVTRMVPEQQALKAIATESQQRDQRRPARMITLPNGLRVVLKSTDAVELVSMAMVTTGGLMVEDEQTNGIGSAMATLATKGAGGRNAVQVARFFDEAGGNISGTSGNNSFVWQSTVLADRFDETLDVFADIIIRPTFDAGELEILRPRLIQDIKRVEQNLIPEAFKHARGMFFTDSPYSMLSSGSESVMASLSAEALRDWHEKHVVAGSSVLSIWGSFDEEAVEKRIVELFSQMPEGKTEPEIPQAHEPAQDVKLHVVPTRNVGSAVVVYTPGMTLDNIEDCLAMDVLDTIISGYYLPSGWLHNRLRGAELVYVVHASNWAGLAPGAFMTYAACQSEYAPKVLEIITDALDEASRYTPSQEEVDRAVNTILTADILASQSMSNLALNSALSELVGRGFDYLDRMEELYNRVTPQDVKRVGEKYLGRGYFVVVTTNQPDIFGSSE